MVGISFIRLLTFIAQRGSLNFGRIVSTVKYFNSYLTFLRIKGNSSTKPTSFMNFHVNSYVITILLSAHTYITLLSSVKFLY